MADGGTGIAARASFGEIRYAQLWEDADVLVPALGARPGATLVSICSAGDNALAMLTLDPARVVVLDLSAAQIECLAVRIAAFRALSHPEFLELMGSRPSDRRPALLDRATRDLPAGTVLSIGDRHAHALHGVEPLLLPAAPVAAAKGSKMATVWASW